MRTNANCNISPQKRDLERLSTVHWENTVMAVTETFKPTSNQSLLLHLLCHSVQIKDEVKEFMAFLRFFMTHVFEFDYQQHVFHNKTDGVH